MVGRSGAKRGPSELLAAERLEAGRADFFAGFHEEGRVEPELAALLDDGAQRRDVDRVLRLVVGGAAAVVALALLGHRPGIEPGAPLRLEAPDDVAVAIGQHGRQGGALDAFADQERAARRLGVVEHLNVVAHGLEGRADLLGEIGRQIGPALLDLALGVVGDPTRQILDEAAVVPAPHRPLDRRLARHSLTSIRDAGHGTAEEFVFASRLPAVSQCRQQPGTHAPENQEAS